MRQAGRYHSHYQALKLRHAFIELCKEPRLALETTLGPMRDFDFDAAILFSDLLFPLEAMGMGLRYDPGPKLDWHLREPADLARLQGGVQLLPQLAFQGEAMRLIRAALPMDKGLLGFVGGPLTLFFYAAEGSHQGELANARAGLVDGRFSGFCDKLLDLLAANMELQARGGADTIAVLDTCAGEISADLYRDVAVPALRELVRKFKLRCPDVPVTYYSKGTGETHWAPLRDLPIDALGIDWRHDMTRVLTQWGDRFAIQGNVDPEWLHLPTAELETRLREYFLRIRALPQDMRKGWICGLGHGVLQKTPEENVRLFVRLQKEIYG
jgi:uroporphyrinogen decarboxylase